MALARALTCQAASRQVLPRDTIAALSCGGMPERSSGGVADWPDCPLGEGNRCGNQGLRRGIRVFARDGAAATRPGLSDDCLDGAGLDSDGPKGEWNRKSNVGQVS